MKILSDAEYKALINIKQDAVETNIYKAEMLKLQNELKEYKKKVEKEIEREIRTGKKSPWTNLKIQIDGDYISGDSGKESFTNAFEKILEKVDPITISVDFNRIFKEKKEDYAEYKQNQCEKIGDFYLDCQSSTKEKAKQLKEVFVKYNIDGDVDIK